MAVYISVVSAKGGTGKSTVTSALAVSLADSGKKVLVADLDIGLKTQDLLLHIPGLVYNFGDVLDKRISADDAVLKHPVNSNISLLAPPDDISEGFSLNGLTELLQSYGKSYDYVIMDMPTGLGIGLYISRKIANMVIAVTTVDKVAVRAAKKLSDIVSDVCATEPRLIVNKISVDAVLASGYTTIDDIIDATQMQLIGAVPYDIAINNKIDLNSGSKKQSSQINAIFNAIAKRISGENVPIVLDMIKK